MNRIGIGVAVVALLLVGCENNGRGNSAVPADSEGEAVVIKPNPYQGPGGGEVADKTSPAGTASMAEGGQTAAVFPTTAQPLSTRTYMYLDFMKPKTVTMPGP